jgi:acyl carrier protein phosphodiesterase
MTHATYDEILHRITVCYDLRTQAHDRMMDGVNPRIDPLSDEWAELAALYDQLAGESDRLYSELTRREQELASA